MKYKYILWDWNGTILDDVTINYEIINTLLEKRGFSPMQSIELYKELFDFPVINFYSEIGFDFEQESFQSIAREYSFLYDERFFEAEPFCDVENTLRQFKEKGIDQLIVSASQHNLLQNQVCFHSLEHYFSDILGTRDIYAHSKVDIAINWMQEKGISPNEVLFVGDTTHDFEVAKNIGCDCVLIARGHNSESRLSALGVPVLKDTKQLWERVI